MALKIWQQAKIFGPNYRVYISTTRASRLDVRNLGFILFITSSSLQSNQVKRTPQ